MGKLQPVQGLEAINRAIAGLQGLGEWSTQVMENAMRLLCAELNLKPAVFFGLLRVAITGRTISPPLFQTMEVLGREKCFTRLEAALDKLKN